MSEPFLGEIRMFAGNFAPRGWAFCNGQLMSIAQNDALFSLVGTNFGGDGVTSFALPNQQGRLPVGQGQGPGLSARTLGEASGAESVPLTVNQIPQHSHSFSATSTAANIQVPNNTALPATLLGTGTLYAIPGANPLKVAAMAAASVGVAGGNQPHNNIMPVLAVSFIIALEGVFPSRN